MSSANRNLMVGCIPHDQTFSRNDVSTTFTQSVVEDATFEQFSALGYAVLHEPTITSGEPEAERTRYERVVLKGRLHEPLRRLNPMLPPEATEEAS